MTKSVSTPAARIVAQRPQAWHVVLWIAIVIIVMLGSCGQQIDAQQQIAQGKIVYQDHCARCHGEQGGGKRGPTLIGPHHTMRGYGTAQGLYTYTSQVMPFDKAGSLKPDEYWAVLAYLLHANGIRLPESALDQTNAAQIRIDQP